MNGVANHRLLVCVAAVALRGKNVRQILVLQRLLPQPALSPSSASWPLLTCTYPQRRLLHRHTAADAAAAARATRRSKEKDYSRSSSCGSSRWNCKTQCRGDAHRNSCTNHMSCNSSSLTQRVSSFATVYDFSPSRAQGCYSHSCFGSTGRAAAQVAAEGLSPAAAAGTYQATSTIERTPSTTAEGGGGSAGATAADLVETRTGTVFWCYLHSQGEMCLLSHLLRSRCYHIRSKGRKGGSLLVPETVSRPSIAVGNSYCNSSSGGWRGTWSTPTRTAGVHERGVCGSVKAAASVGVAKKKSRTATEHRDVAAFLAAAAAPLGGVAASLLGGAQSSAFPAFVPRAPVRRRAGESAAAFTSGWSAKGAFSAAAFSTAAAAVGVAPRGGDRRSGEAFDETEKESPSFGIAGAALLFTLALRSSNNSDCNNRDRTSSTASMLCADRIQEQSRRRASALLVRDEEQGRALAGRSVLAARQVPPAQCHSSAASVDSRTYRTNADLTSPATSFPFAPAPFEGHAIPNNCAAAVFAAAGSKAPVPLDVAGSCAASTPNCLNVASAAAATDSAAAADKEEVPAKLSAPAAAAPVPFDVSVDSAGAAGRPSAAAAASASSSVRSAAARAGTSAAAAVAAAQPAWPDSRSGSAAGSAGAAAAAPPAFPAPASSRGLYQELTADSALQLFSGAAHPELAREIAAHLNVSLGRVQLGRFLDGECLVRVLDEVRGRDVFVIQSAPAAGGDLHSSLVELFLLITTLRRASAKRVTAVMPYFPYGRETELKGQRDDICTPMAAADLAVLLQVCGADAVIFVDVHNPRIEGFFTLGDEPPIPMSNIDPHGLAAQYLQKKDLVKPVVVATDNTAGEKASSMWTVMKQYGINASFTSMVCDAPKRQVREGAPILPPSFAAAAAGPSSPRGAAVAGRAAGAAGDAEQQQQPEHQLLPEEQSGKELKNWNLVGAVEGCDCVIVDDIIDTAEKAEGTAKDLKAGGARRIFMFASHGILSKGAVDRINNSPIEEVVVTNTVPIPPHIYCEKLVVLSVGKLLAEAIKRVHEEQSVSVLCSSESNPRNA